MAVTAWQMLFDYARAQAGQTVMILGAAGNVGAYAVQLAAKAKLHVVAIVGQNDVDYVRNLGAETVVNHQLERFDDAARSVDVVVDTVGGDTRDRSLRVLSPGGILVSVVSIEAMPRRSDVRSVFFYVEVTTARLNAISELFDRGELSSQVGTVLPLQEVRAAHQMLAGARHTRGKIVLQVTA